MTGADTIVWLDRERFVPGEKWTTSGAHIVYRDHWWPTDELGRLPFHVPVDVRKRHDEGRECLEYPQTNANKRIVDRHTLAGTVEVVQIPVVIVPMDMTEYY